MKKEKNKPFSNDLVKSLENTTPTCRLSLRNASFEEIKQSAIQRDLEEFSEYLADEVGLNGHSIGSQILLRADERLRKAYLSKHITRDEIKATMGSFGLWFSIGTHHTESEIFESEDISEIIKTKPSILARLGAIMYLKLSWNATKDRVKEVERFLCYADFPEKFDEEKEVMDNAPWVVPITGSLYDDIRANFIAKQLLKLDYEGVKKYIQHLLDYFIYTQMRYWVESGMRSKIYALLPINMTHREAMEFLQIFDDEYGEKLCAENEECFTECATSMQKVLMRQARLGNARIVQLLMGNCIGGNVGNETLYVPIRTATTSNEMCSTDKALPSLNAYIMCGMTIGGVNEAVNNQINGVFNPAAKERSLLGKT